MKDRYARASRAIAEQPSALAALRSGDMDLFTREAAAILFLHMATAQEPSLSRVEQLLAKSKPQYWVPIVIGFFWSIFTLGFIWSLAPEMQGRFDLTLAIIVGFCGFFTAIGSVLGWYQGRKDAVRVLAAREKKAASTPEFQKDRYARAARAIAEQHGTVKSLRGGDTTRFVQESAALLFLHFGAEKEPHVGRIEQLLAKSKPQYWVPFLIGFIWAVVTLGFIYSLSPELRRQFDITLAIIVGFCAFFTGLGYVLGWYQGRRDAVRALGAREEHAATLPEVAA